MYFNVSLKKMIAIKLLILSFLILPKLGTSQVTMDIELLGGITLNGNKYDYSDDSYSFELKDGASYGIGFDIWFQKKYSLSFGYRQSQSGTRSTFIYPAGFPTGARSFSNGVLKDRIFYLGVKKKFDLGKAFSLIPLISLYYNPFFFDNEELKYSSTVQVGNTSFSETSNFYARFNGSGKKSYGALGARIGIGIEKEIPNIGSFSLNIKYNIDMLRSVDRIVYAYNNAVLTNSGTGSVEQTNYYYNFESQRFARNLLQIEVGFKMPCSILLSKGK